MSNETERRDTEPQAFETVEDEHIEMDLPEVETDDAGIPTFVFKDELNPDDNRAIFNLGNVLRRSGQTELAAKVLNAFNERQRLLARAKALKAAVDAQPENIDALSCCWLSATPSLALQTFVAPPRFAR